MKSVVVLFLALLASALAFHFHAPVSRAPRMTMVFNNIGKKSTPQQGDYKINQGTANKGVYIPDGISPEQYQKTLAAEAAKKEAAKKKFFKGKVTESLTEWMQKNEAKGLSGQDLNRKGHKMVKAKYDGWFTNESPV